MADLGVIERVDLREVWPHEAQDFTPWLAENLDKLGAALGLDLELQSAEAAVGAFSLDVLAHDLGSNRSVIIENQLEGSNHDHLGKLLTYAAGYDAYAVVWLCREFREEHRAALDWLNQRTGDGTQFFGVAVEAWRIDGSRPAPHFRVVAMPNNWQKRTVSVAREGSVLIESEQGKRYQEFYRPIIEAVEGELRFAGSRNSTPRRWLSFQTGVRGVRYGANFYRYSGTANVELTIWRSDKEWNERLFDLLIERKEQIEMQLAGDLEWERLDDYQSCRISAKRQASIDDDDDSLAHLQEWMTDRLLAFKRVFTPHLQELVAD